jgi:hypothetical protein
MKYKNLITDYDQEAAGRSAEDKLFLTLAEDELNESYIDLDAAGNDILVYPKPHRDGKEDEEEDEDDENDAYNAAKRKYNDAVKELRESVRDDPHYKQVSQGVLCLQELPREGKNSQTKRKVLKDWKQFTNASAATEPLAKKRNSCRKSRGWSHRGAREQLAFSRAVVLADSVKNAKFEKAFHEIYKIV